MPRSFPIAGLLDLTLIQPPHIFLPRVRAGLRLRLFEQPGYFSTAGYLMKMFQQ